MSIETRLKKLEASLNVINPTVYEIVEVKVGETKKEALKRMRLPAIPADNVCRWLIFVVA